MINGFTLYIAIRGATVIVQHYGFLGPLAILIVAVFAIPFLFSVFIDPIFTLLIQSSQLGRLSVHQKQRIGYRNVFYVIEVGSLITVFFLAMLVLLFNAK